MQNPSFTTAGAFCNEDKNTLFFKRFAFETRINTYRCSGSALEKNGDDGVSGPRELEYWLDILRATKGSHVEVY